MPIWQSNFVNTKEGRLHYTRTGGAKYPLVLAHGFSDDGLCWTSAAEQLAQAYDVIMVDARGHGHSDMPENVKNYGPLEQADDLAEVITALRLEHPLLLGHSMGATATLTLAGRYPDLPRAIALEDPPPWWKNAPGLTPFNEQWKKDMRTWLTNLKRQTPEAIVAAQHLESPNWPEVDLGPWAVSKLRFALRFLDRVRSAPIDWPSLLKGIKCPALLITAEPERGAMVTPADATALQTLLPQLRTVRIAQAGHSIRRDQPARFLEAVSAFFAELTPAS